MFSDKSETDAAVVTKKTDVANEEDVKGLINLALDTFSQVDILCNNAGITGDVSSLSDQDQGIWHQVYDVNVLGAVLAVKHAAKPMQARQKGSIVNTSSVAGLSGGSGHITRARL